MSRRHMPLAFVFLAATANAGAESQATDAGTLVRALWLVQRYGTAEAIDPRYDEHTKAVLAKAVGKEGSLTAQATEKLIDPRAFAKLAGGDGKLDPDEMKMALEQDRPRSRKRLLPEILDYADLLTTSFDRIDEAHRAAAETLVDWVAANYHPGRPLHVVVVCTGNSRRSILGATMGNIAAAYYGMPEIRFHSGGTAPSAFNSRAVSALREVGVVVEPTGREAARGDVDTPNPVSRVRWGQPADEEFQMLEFSKRYNDPSNPQRGFAALMICAEADANCPVVPGASIRISMPYLDPKLFDGSPYEAVKYAERRDDLGRLMLAVMMQVRNRLAAAD